MEKTLNKLLDAEADLITNAHRYERNEERRDTRAGHYTRKLLTTSREVKLNIIWWLQLGSRASINVRKILDVTSNIVIIFI